MKKDPRIAVKRDLDKGYDALSKLAASYLKQGKRLRREKREEEALALEGLAVKYMKEVKNWFVAAKPPAKENKTETKGFWEDARINTASPPRERTSPASAADASDALERFDPGADDPPH